MTWMQNKSRPLLKRRLSLSQLLLASVAIWAKTHRRYRDENLLDQCLKAAGVEFALGWARALVKLLVLSYGANTFSTGFELSGPRCPSQCFIGIKTANAMAISISSAASADYSSACSVAVGRCSGHLVRGWRSR